MDRLTAAMVPHVAGHFTYVADLAAEDWVVTRERRPLREGALVLVDYDDGRWPLALRYSEGKFRNSGGHPWGDPKWWAYLRFGRGENVHQAESVPMPEGAPSAVPAALQYLVDALLRSYAWKEVMDAADRSPFKREATGAPEGS